MQSYQNVSNSQPLQRLLNLYFGCKRLCKVIKMLAIHNLYLKHIKFVYVANAYAKLSKCQQFTTYLNHFTQALWLQTLMQSYQNVSNSQLCLLLYKKYQSCKRLCKVIKMLAIHNSVDLRSRYRRVANAYAKLSKCQQFTTYYTLCKYHNLLQTLMQSYQNVSNSQPKGHVDSELQVANAYAKLSKCQQFTTVLSIRQVNLSLQTLMQSYQNVSNSQLTMLSQFYL